MCDLSIKMLMFQEHRIVTGESKADLRGVESSDNSNCRKKTC